MTRDETVALQEYAKELSEPRTEGEACALETVSANELQAAVIAPLLWVVEKILPEGLTILAAPPKFGKSWLVLDLCISVALGRTFLGFRTEQSGALYLALEDGFRRLQARMASVLEGDEAPKNLHFAISSRALDSGLREQIDGFLNTHPNTRLIVVDVLARVRSTANARQKDLYRLDYYDMSVLQEIAQRHRLALVVVHHARKMRDAADVFNAISGTNGIFGGADGAWILQKDSRDCGQTTLHVTGREIAAECFRLTFDNSACRWRMLGAGEHAKPATDAVFTLVCYLLERGGGEWRGTAAQMVAEGAALGLGLTDPRAVGRRLPGLVETLKGGEIVWTQRRTSAGTLHSFRRTSGALPSTSTNDE